MKTISTSTLNGIEDAAAACNDISDDDEYYMELMAQILDAPPKSGPPGHPGRVSSRVYIGNQDNADDLDLLPALGITHVLNMAGTRNFDATRSPYKPSVGIKSFLMIQAEDYDEYDIADHFADAIAFLDRAKASGGNALVHCNLGVNRSGAVVAAYLMVSERRTLLRVVTELKAKRSLIIANVGFRRQLVNYARCRGLLDPVDRKALPVGRPVGSNETTKMDKQNGTVVSNGEAKTIVSRDGGSNEVDTASPSTVARNNEVVDGSLGSNCYRIQSETNGTNEHSRYTSVDVTGIVSAARRERLLNDVDAVIEKLSLNDNDDCSDENASSDEEVVSRSSTSRRLLSNGYIRRVDTSSGGRNRRIFVADRSPMSTINNIRSSTSSGSLTSTTRYSHLEPTSPRTCSDYTPVTRSHTSVADLATTATYPRLTNNGTSFADSYGSSITSPRAGRPLSAQTITAVGGHKYYEYDDDTEHNLDQYNGIHRSGSRRNHDDDDVNSFFEEADRRARLSGAVTKTVRSYVLPSIIGVSPGSVLTSSRRSCTPRSNYRPSSSSRPVRLSTSPSALFCSSHLPHFTTSIPPSRSTTSPYLSTNRNRSTRRYDYDIDDIDDDDSYINDSAPSQYSIYNRIVPTKVTSAPGHRSSSYLR